MEIDVFFIGGLRVITADEFNKYMTDVNIFCMIIGEFGY